MKLFSLRFVLSFLNYDGGFIMSIEYNINAQQTIEEAFETILHANFLLLKKFEPMALNIENNEGVHQMRVSLRKMRSLLFIFKPIFSKKVTCFLSKDMQYAGLELTKARDLDVYIEEHFQKKELTDTEKVMYKIAKKYQKEEYKKVARLIKSKRFKKFHKSIAHWISSKGWKDDINTEERERLQENILPFAIEVIELYQKRVISLGADIENLDDASLHKLRILCKKLRYSTDFFATLFDTKMSLFTDKLKKLQDVLGVLHDQSVIKELHKTLLKGKKNKKLHKFAQKLEMKQKEKSIEIKKLLKMEWEAFIQIKQPWL